MRHQILYCMVEVGGGRGEVKSFVNSGNQALVLFGSLSHAEF